jgi:hypothetical protein
MSDTYTGTIAKQPKTSAKTLFFMLKQDNGKSIPVVGFFEDFEDAYAQEVRGFKLNDTVTFVGRYHTNRQTGKAEIVIEGPVVKELTVEEALAMPDPNLAPVEERVLPERKYKFKHPKYKEEVVFWTDGFYIWTEGKKDKKEKLTYEFIQGYNKHVTSDKWLSPDWYTIEVAKRHQAHLDANPRLAAIVDELSVY